MGSSFVTATPTISPVLQSIASMKRSEFCCSHHQYTFGCFRKMRNINSHRVSLPHRVNPVSHCYFSKYVYPFLHSLPSKAILESLFIWPSHFLSSLEALEQRIRPNSCSLHEGGKLYVARVPHVNTFCLRKLYI